MANLLPYKEQSALDIQRHRRLRAALCVLVSAMFAFATVMLIPSFVILVSAKESGAQRLATTRRLGELQQDAGAGNAVARMKEKAELLGHEKGRMLPHDLFDRIVRLLPKGVLLDTIGFTRGANVVTVDLSGAAAQRADLIAFGDALKASGLFTQVTIPLDTLAQSSDLQFRLSLSLAETPR